MPLLQRVDGSGVGRGVGLGERGGGVLLSQRLIGCKPQGNAAADWSPEATREREKERERDKYSTP